MNRKSSTRTGTNLASPNARSKCQKVGENEVELWRSRSHSALLERLYASRSQLGRFDAVLLTTPFFVTVYSTNRVKQMCYSGRNAFDFHARSLLMLQHSKSSYRLKE